MITVIIPYSGDRTYLVRCVNAIKRQTCKDVQLLLIAAQRDEEMARQYGLEVIVNCDGRRYGGINEAIQRAKGEYLFFCSVTSVPAPNTLETLVREYAADNSILRYGSCYEEQEQGFEVYEDMQASCYGKLYDMGILRRGNVQFREGSPFAEMQFVAEYAAYMKDMALSEKIYIYETDAQWKYPESADEKIDPEDWKALLRGIGGLKETIAGQLLRALCSRLEHYSVASRELVDITRTHSDNILLNYAVARPMVKNWWAAVQLRQDPKSFEDLKVCLAGYEEHEEYLELLLMACDMRKEQYPYLKNDLWTALYFIRENDRLREQAMNTMLDAALTERDAIRDTDSVRSGLIKVGTAWYYYRNGVIDREYTGLAQNQYGWYYVKNGMIDRSYIGLAENQHGTWRIEKGTIDYKANGYCRIGGREVFLTGGKVDGSKNGFLCSNGEWRWYREGRVDTEYNGLAKNEYGWWYIEKGEINYEFEGLAENEYGWWYIKDGTIDYSFKGYAKNHEGWHYVEKGTVSGSEPEPAVRDKTPELPAEDKDIKEIITQIQRELTGAELAEYTVSKYAGGELGIKTIFRSLGAWIKYKL